MSSASRPGSADPLQSRYEETLYHDQFFAEFELARLLGFARLFRLEAVTDEIRVLDLGCATGVHLREQAQRYPEVRFTGIDFAPSAIEIGRKAVVEAGLSNVELIHADLREAQVEPEAFDVVLCHGIFSWVADDVKERILLLARQGLKRGGVAAIAYLTYPGWKQREAIRELLLMRTHATQDPEQRIRESALLLRFLHAGYAANGADVHAQSLRAVVESMQQSPKNAFGHDELGQIHDPCYFLQFAEWAAECGLQYLAETDLGTMSVEGLDASAKDLLQHLSPNFLEAQQLVDFVVNRSGRSSLLVRDDATLIRELSPESLAGMSFGTQWWNVTPKNAPAGSVRRMESSHGRSLSVDNPRLWSLLERFTSAQGESVAYEDLRTHAAAHDMADELSEMLLGLLAKGVVEPRWVGVS